MSDVSTPASPGAPAAQEPALTPQCQKASPRTAWVNLGFFVIAASVLTIQILYTRVSNVTFGSGFAFILIPLAILGLGLGGIFVFSTALNRAASRRVHGQLVLWSLAYVLSILVPFVAIDAEHPATIALFFFTGFLTYFLAGTIVSLVFRHEAGRISILYGLSLVGSAVGALGAVLLLERFGMSGSILAVWCLSSCSIPCFALAAGASAKRVVPALLFVAAIAVLSRWGPVDQRLALVCPEYGPPLASRSNSFSQVDTYAVGPTDAGSMYAMLIDCRTSTILHVYDSMNDVEWIRDSHLNLPLKMPGVSSALIIGSGAGVNVLAAVMAGIPEITAVEVNPLVIDNVETLSGAQNVYRHDSVRLFVEEGRSFVNGSQENYDLIYLPGGMRVGSLGLGSHLFTVNYLHTKEAMTAYLDHLSEDGVLVISMKHKFRNRFFSTVAAGLTERGIDPAKRMFVIRKDPVEREDGLLGSILRAHGRSGMKWLMFVTNRDLTGDREHEFRALADAKGLDSRRLTRKALQRYQQFQAVTDDNPYLRNTAAMRERQVALHETDWMTSAPVGMNRPRTIRYLVAFLAVLLLACLLAMVVPLYRSPRLRTRNIRRLLAFFAAIGIGFITLELTFIHKFTLFLGQPIYAVSVTLASICFFGGLGSLLTARVGDHDIPRQMVRAMWPLVIVTGVFVVALNPLLNALVALSPGLKILVAIGMLGIPSVFLGMMFPLGLRLAKNTSETIIPWMVGIDGMTSVVGGTVSYLVALFFGFNAALILGIGMYLLALGIVSGIGSDA